MSDNNSPELALTKVAVSQATGAQSDKGFRRRFLSRLLASEKLRPRLAVALVLATLVGLAGWGMWYHTTAPERWFRQARSDLEQGKSAKVDKYIRLLWSRGRSEEASFLEGLKHIRYGRDLLDAAFFLSRQELIESHLLGLLNLAGALGDPSPARWEIAARCTLHSAPWAELRPTGKRRVETQERVRAAFREAIEQLNAVVSEGPLRTEAAFLRGDCLFRLGDLRRSAAMLRYVLDQDPDHIEAHRLLASLYYDTGVVGRAIYHLEEVARLDPEDGRPYRLLGSIHKDFRNATRAVAAYRAALERRLHPPVQAEVARELAEVLITELGQHREALSVLEQVPPPFDQEPDVLVLRAECLWQLDPDKKKAQALVDAALRSDPQSVSALTLWGKLLLHQERPHESVAVLEQARHLDPFDHKCRNQLIAAYAMLVRDAEDDLVRSLAVQGLTSSWAAYGAPCPGSLVCSCAATTQQRYYASMREDHMKASQIIVDTLLKLSELSAKAEVELWNADIRFQIGAIWVQLRRPGMARMWLTAALACDPQHQGAQEALKKLELEEILLP